jgi:hypothetical protein
MIDFVCSSAPLVHLPINLPRTSARDFVREIADPPVWEGKSTKGLEAATGNLELMSQLHNRNSKDKLSTGVHEPYYKIT